LPKAGFSSRSAYFSGITSGMEYLLSSRAVRDYANQL
jgi:hypothetical protein